MSLPSYEEFRQALADPARRAQIGLVITDNDAQSLAGNEEWARNYFDSWIAMAAPAPTAVMPEAPQAPAAPSPFSSAPTEQFSAPAAPAAAPFGQPAGYAPAGYQAAPQQGYAAPQQGQPFGAQPGSQSMPQGQMPKKGLPGWALGVIIGGAALVLLGGIGVTALVLTAGNNDKDTASSSQESDDSSTTAPDDADTDPSEEPFEEPFDPEAEDPDDLFGDFDLDYSEADAASYLAVAAPIYGLEASEYMDQDLIDDTMLTGGEAACVSLETGYSEADLVESLTAADLSSSDAQALVDAAKQYLCN